MAHGAKKPLSYEEQMEIALALSAKEAKEKAKVCLNQYYLLLVS
jgi:hypothetical protein